MSGPDPATAGPDALPGLPHDEDGPVFAEPWQAQAFALTLQLHRDGHFTWAEWSAALAAKIAEAGSVSGDDGQGYYRHWLAALEHLAVTRELATAEVLAKCKSDWKAAYERTPHGKPVRLP